MNPKHLLQRLRSIALDVAVLFAFASFVNAQVYEKVYDFSDGRQGGYAYTKTNGRFPGAGLIQGNDGNYYGTTTSGGLINCGTVFKITSAGVLTTLVEFTGNGPSNKGTGPSADLVQGSDGNFYGTTYYGGSSILTDPDQKGYGTVFKMSQAGVLTTLVEFTNNGTSNKGRLPSADLVQGNDGNFYGTTSLGGTNDFGTIFKITPAGVMTTLVNFTGVGGASKGSSPVSGLVQGSDGNFYGTTRNGGASDFGTVFKMTAAGIMTTLLEFTGNGASNKGREPRARLVQGIDGNFYGTTYYGGASVLNDISGYGYGTVFKMTSAGVLTTLVEFTNNDGNANGGYHPTAALVQGSDGNLFGTTAEGGSSGVGTVFTMTPAGVATTLVNFTGAGDTNKGSGPFGLLQGSDGNFFGTTGGGGASGDGTVFKITPAGVLTTLMEFTEGSTKIGSGPVAGLVQSYDGSFYGTTSNYDGTVFKITPAGELTTLVNFTGVEGANKGSSPDGKLVLGRDINFYGTTKSGGANNLGTVFKMTPDGIMTTLVEFTGSGGANMGAGPAAGLVQDTDDTFYGTTTGGGANNYGTVFKMRPAGELTTLVEFTGATGAMKGQEPRAGVVKGGDGNFYGTTFSGGANNYGTVFKMTLGGLITTLVEFTGNGTSKKGSFPQGRLIRGSDGNFYGTTWLGGASNSGTVFKMTPTGVLTTLVEFTGNGASNKGSRPTAGLVQGNDGSYYGTTQEGGASNGGTVFKMTAAGVLTTLVEFTDPFRTPCAELLKAADGNFYGTIFGPDGGIFRLITPGAPGFIATSALVQGETEAQLEARVNARGSTTTVTLEYGTDPFSYPNTVQVKVGLTGYQTKLVGTTLSGLSPGTTYYYRFRAVSSAGTTVSTVNSFGMLAKPIVIATAASGLQSTTATFNGTLNARNFDSTATFEWGTDGISFSNTVSAIPGTVTGSAPVAVSAAVAGLTKGTRYFYRIVANNAAGTVISGVQDFIALTEPIATIGTAAALSTTRAQVAGAVNANGSSSNVSFEYGTDEINFPNSVSAVPASVTGSDSEAVSTTLTGLQQGTTYYYRIRATGPGGTGLSNIGQFSLSILSGLAQTYPDPPPPATGTVTINFDPPTRGAWRFTGETAWRNSGLAATNLASGQRLIEFLPVAGYIPPPVETLDVVSGGNLILDRMYFETQTAGSGGLTVHLKPDELAAPGVPEATRAQWRFVGESQWRDGDGPPVSSLSAGSYLVECKPVDGKVTPPTASIAITNGSSSELTLTYFTANNTGAATPAPLTFSSVSADEDLPFAYVGQIRSEVGSSTGFVVKRRVVATAGHVVFDDGSLSYVKSMEWLFQRHAGQFEPKPQVPRGSYLATGYATQRIADNSPGQGSPQSQTLDYAALYFLEEAGRGGYGGFLATDAGDDNEFLTSPSQKILAGYAVDGIPATDKGKLHATTAFTAALTPAFGETWISTAVRGYGGCSGGPLFVRRSNGLYLPAAIYLGGNGQTVVRAIDSAVVDLFLRAEVSGNGGDNNTGGGITLASFTSIGNATQPGALEVTIQPAAARAAGAGWRIKPETSYRSSGSQKSGLSGGNYQLQFPTISGFQVPTQYTVAVTAGQLQPVTFTYAAVNAAPTIGNVANLTIDEDNSIGPISVTVDDPDGPNNALVLNGSSSNTSLIPNGNIDFGGSGGNRTVTVTPAANQNGSATITLTVSDGDLTDTDTFVVTVNPVNDTPTIANIATQSIPANTSTGAIPFTIGDIETAASSLTLTRSTSNSTLVPLSGIVFGGSGASRNVTITPAANQLGNANITVTVSDGVLTTSRTFDLTVIGTVQETWRFTNFGTTANTGNSADNFDADGDGSSNLSEYAAGTNPNSATDVFKILTSTKTATTFIVTAVGKASRSYVLERRASLATGSWTTVTAVGPLAGDGPVALTDPATPANSAFYRLRVSSP